MERGLYSCSWIWTGLAGCYFILGFLSYQPLILVEGDQRGSFPKIGFVGQDIEALVGASTDFEGPGAYVDANYHTLLHN